MLTAHEAALRTVPIAEQHVVEQEAMKTTKLQRKGDQAKYRIRAARDTSHRALTTNLVIRLRHARLS
jgi:hypothetical protein